MDFGKKNMAGEAAGNGRLLQEIEAFSKALNLNRNPKKALDHHRSISAGKTHIPDITKTRVFRENSSSSSSSSSAKDKKSSSSIWNWKPLKALSSHIRNHRRFSCRFSLQVHSVESLPADFDGLSLRVYWKRRDGGLETRPARVFQGMAEFEETLLHNCSVYGARSGPHHSVKYEAKYFLLYVGVVGAAGVDLGKHRIDLTRLLPLTLEELEEEKSSGKWTTSFKLSGKAKGAVLNVSFGFMCLGDDRKGGESFNSKLNRVGTIKPSGAFERTDGRGTLRRLGSLPGAAPRWGQLPSRSTEDVKILHEVLPSSKSEVVSSLINEELDYKHNFQVFSDQDLKSDPKPMLESPNDNYENGSEDGDFTVIEQGIEIAGKGEVRFDQTPNINFGVQIINQDGINKGEVALEEAMKLDQESNEKSNLGMKELVMEEIDSALHTLSILEAEGLEPLPSLSGCAETPDYTEVKSNYKKGKVGKALSLDDVTESVASEFLSMLGLEHSPFSLSSDSDPESPRERLWKQFKKDSLVGGECVFGLDVGKEIELDFVNSSPAQFYLGALSEDFELSSILNAAEAEHQRAGLANKGKTRATMLEDLETEALMQEWGLNENAFQRSPSASGFGSPINLPSEEPLELPPLAEGFGPFVQTEDGGFLRSMNPSLFRNAKNNGSLIMQVSSPLVVPAEMGSGIMEILQQLASVGIEKLSVQASKLMPLKDITGKTMQQIAWAAPNLEAGDRQGLLHQIKPDGVSSDAGHNALHTRKRGKGSSKSNLTSFNVDTSSEYVSLEDLAPLAMDKIEALSVEGLRIQSGMSEEEAPSNIFPQSIGEVSALEGVRAKSVGSLGLEGAAGLQLLDIKDGNEDVDGLMGLSLSLDEWMKLDAGIVEEEEKDSSRTSKVLAAHHANCTAKDLISGGWKGNKRGKSKKWGLLGNNFTVALMVQLRDPLRNYEPVGTPMLALIQVERVYVPPKAKIYSTVSEKADREDEVDEPELAPKVIKEEKKEEEVMETEAIPQFKITEVHVAGIKTEPVKKKLWGTSTQQQSGSRWLLASGMGKNNKHPFMKSKAVTKSPQVATTTVQPGDTLWSISSRVHGTGAKWKELAALNPHIRNPNVIFPNETIRLH